MSALTQAQQAEIDLDRLVSHVDIEARDLGHQPVWTYGEDGESASVRCDCGLSAAVRIPAWKAGRLRLQQHPAP